MARGGSVSAARRRRASAPIVALVLLATMASRPTPGSALEVEPQPILLSDTEFVWIQGEVGLVTLNWTTEEPLTDFRVSAVGGGDGVAVEYDDPGLGHATLDADDDLASNEIDSTSFLLRPTAETPADTFHLDVAVSWAWGGRRHDAVVRLAFQQRADDGRPFLILTESAVVPAIGDGSRNWVELSFLGLDADLRDFAVSIDGDLPVYYPQTSYTSLHHNDVLEVGERDVARFWLDPASIEPGTYELTVHVDYVDGSGRQATDRPLVITVGR